MKWNNSIISSTTGGLTLNGITVTTASIQHIIDLLTINGEPYPPTTGTVALYPLIKGNNISFSPGPYYDGSSQQTISAIEETSGALSATAPAAVTAGRFVLGGATVISMTQSGTATDGWLSAIDWNIFNNKQAAGNYITALTGDVTASGPGSVAATIANNAVSDAKFRQSAGLSLVGRAANTTGNVADITAGTDGNVMRRSGTSIGFGAIDLSNPNAVTSVLGPTLGGTGLFAYTLGDLLYASAANTLAKLAFVGTATRYLKNTGGAATIPEWGQVDMTNGVTGTLPFGNGGTGATAFSSTHIPYSTGTAFTSEANLNYDATNDSLGVGATAGTANALTVTKTVTGTGSNKGAVITLAQTQNGASGNFPYALEATNNQNRNGNNQTGLVAAAQCFADISGAGTATSVVGVMGRVRSNTGTATSAAALMALANLTASGGTLTNSYGLYIENQATGTNKYGFFSAHTGNHLALGIYNTTVGGTNIDVFADNTGLLGQVTSARVIDGQLNKINERDISTTESAQILSLKPTVYDRVDGTKNETGLIAEDVALVMPQIVSYETTTTTQTLLAEDGVTTYTKQVWVNTEPLTPKSVNYSRLIVPMLDRIQRQEKRINDLEALVNSIIAVLVAAGLWRGGVVAVQKSKK